MPPKTERCHKEAQKAQKHKSRTENHFVTFVPFYGSICFPRLRLDGGDRYSVDDVARRAAAREVVCGFVESLKDRADRGRARKAFR